MSGLGMVKCCFCNEEISFEALECVYCKKLIQPQNEVLRKKYPHPTDSLKRGYFLTISFTIFLIYLGYILNWQ